MCIRDRYIAPSTRKKPTKGSCVLPPKVIFCLFSSSVIDQRNRQSLDAFMEKIECGDEKKLQTWNEYLDHLAVLISNLRMAYDLDIILGGDVGGVVSDYMLQLGEKVMAYNGFEHDISYLKNCTYKKEASAVGAAKYFFTKHMVEL